MQKALDTESESFWRPHQIANVFFDPISCHKQDYGFPGTDIKALL